MCMCVNMHMPCPGWRCVYASVGACVHICADVFVPGQEDQGLMVVVRVADHTMCGRELTQRCVYIV